MGWDVLPLTHPAQAAHVGTLKPNSIYLSVRRDLQWPAKIYADGRSRKGPYQYGCGSLPLPLHWRQHAEAGIAFGDLQDFYLDAACANAGISYTEDDAKATKRAVIAHGKKRPLTEGTT